MVLLTVAPFAKQSNPPFIDTLVFTVEVLLSEPHPIRMLETSKTKPMQLSKCERFLDRITLGNGEVASKLIAGIQTIVLQRA